MKADDHSSHISRLRALERSLRAKYPNLGRILESIVWLSADKIRLVVNLALSVWMARQFGPQLFGELNYAFAITAILGIGADLGLESILVRELVKYPERAPQLLATAFWLRMTAALLCYGILLVYSTLFTPPETLPLIALFGLMFFAQSPLSARSWFQARLESRLLVVVQTYVFLAATVARISLLLLHRPLLEFAAVIVLEQGAGAVALWLIYQRTSRFRWTAFSPALAKELLYFGWPLMLSGASIAVYMKIDQVMLQQMLGPEVTGTYAAAVRISEACYFIPAILASSLFPSIVRSRERSLTVYTQRLQQYFSLNALLALAVSIPISILSPRLVILLYGNDYSDAGPILAVHIWASLFVFLGVAREQFLLVEGFVRFSLAATLSGAIVNVALNFLLIPRSGGFGAAVATAISYAVSAFLSSFTNRDVRQAGWMQLRAVLTPGYGLKGLIR